MTMGPTNETLRKPMVRRAALGAAGLGAAAAAVAVLSGEAQAAPFANPAAEPATDGGQPPVGDPPAPVADNREVVFGDETFLRMCEPIKNAAGETLFQFFEGPGNELDVTMLRPDFIREMADTYIPGKPMNVVFEAPFPTSGGTFRNGLEYLSSATNIYRDKTFSGQSRWAYTLDTRFETPLVRIAPLKSGSYDIKDLINNPEMSEPLNLSTSLELSAQLLRSAGYSRLPEEVSLLAENGPALVGLSVKAPTA
jgi:hypothetical protein